MRSCWPALLLARPSPAQYISEPYSNLVCDLSRTAPAPEHGGVYACGGRWGKEVSHLLIEPRRSVSVSTTNFDTNPPDHWPETTDDTLRPPLARTFSSAGQRHHLAAAAPPPLLPGRLTDVNLSLVVVVVAALGAGVGVPLVLVLSLAYSVYVSGSCSLTHSLTHSPSTRLKLRTLASCKCIRPKISPYCH